MKNILIIMTQEKELKIADEASIQKRILLKHFTKKKDFEDEKIQTKRKI